MFNGRVGYVPDKCLDLSLESSTKLPWVPAMKSHNLRCEVAVDLSFEKGSVIKLLIKTLGIWYVGILNGKIGYVPQEKLEILSTASA
ncbi:hypothetical protein BD410DRAFT_130682 [Rickenella mellea]|uniref:SH3 domain-containing protein n=1 Tax=Rickenella mellea TaxID=50990 RepID=A0A4Y7Q9J7_9AGAM|nr:hypothetical protein BD410DRAFT_130682 [Rickenella mellea]